MQTKDSSEFSDRLYFTALIQSLKDQGSVVYHGYSVYEMYHFYCMARPRCQLQRVQRQSKARWRESAS